MLTRRTDWMASLYYFFARVKPDELFPEDRSLLSAVFLGEFESELVDYVGVFDLKLFVLFFGFVPKWVNNIGIKIIISGDEFPEPLSAEFQILALVRIVIFPVATGVYCDYLDFFGVGS